MRKWILEMTGKKQISLSFFRSSFSSSLPLSFLLFFFFFFFLFSSFSFSFPFLSPSLLFPSLPSLPFPFPEKKKYIGEIAQSGGVHYFYFQDPKLNHSYYMPLSTINWAFPSRVLILRCKVPQRLSPNLFLKKGNTTYIPLLIPHATL